MLRYGSEAQCLNLSLQKAYGAALLLRKLVELLATQGVWSLAVKT